ncbi:MAG: hypothetical protein IIA36_06265 [Proteobacteria bacterium]|nr:hypothetical protein [Pseudomonadota bacterium]
MDDTINDTSRNDAAERDQARHTLSAEETSVIFAEAGVPRSVRTVQRYCKKGHLACITIDTEISEKYLIDRNSVERRIKELQQLDRILRSTVDATSREETRHDAAGHATPRHDGSENTTGKIAELEQENLQLTIDRAAKEQVINQLVKERKEHVAQLTEQGRQIGILETRLKQIEAPRDQARESHRTTDPPNEEEGERGHTENTAAV